VVDSLHHEERRAKKAIYRYAKAGKRAEALELVRELEEKAIRPGYCQAAQLKTSHSTGAMLTKYNPYPQTSSVSPANLGCRGKRVYSLKCAKT